MTWLTKIPGNSHADSWINAMIAVGSAMFVSGLAVSAAFAPEWRTLHVLQAFIYVALVMLTRRKHSAGFGAGLAVAAFWNVLLLTTAAHDVMQELLTLVRTGRPQHPDLLLSVFAACGHLLIIIACMIGFARIRPTARQWVQWGVGGVAALAYLIAIVFIFGPPEGVALMKHVFGLK
jgi:hypothetical protein